ncbi:MAG: sulfotransferase, partial [Phycisphaerales bacterium]|nr:sulfotransferase [Phycisphaerales bacterium]
MGKTDAVGEAIRLPPPEAERLLQKHLRKRPRDIAAAEALADLLAGQNRLGELTDGLMRLAHAGGATAGLIRYASDAAVLKKDYATALAMSTLGTKRFPEDAMLWYRRGRAELANADASAAAKSFKVAHELEPDDNIILAALADADLSKGSFPLPDQYAIEILNREPDDASHHARLGTAHRLNNKLDEAEACFLAAISLDASLPSAHAGLAETLESMGRSEDASDQLQPIIEAGDPSFAVVSAWARIRQRLGDRPAAIKAMEKYLASKRGLPNHVSQITMQLGLAYEKAGRPDDAFRCWTQGNAAHRGRWNPQAHEQLVDAMIDTFTSDTLPVFPRATPAPFIPVLVVGMYRSGTTLTEQILSAHPRVNAGGESPAMPDAAGHLATAMGGINHFPRHIGKVPQEQVEEAAAIYHDRIQSHAGTGDYVVDKLPMNYLNLGIASMILPNARVLHIVRDPMDTALSCYSNSFASQMSFTADLEHLGHAISQQQRIMKHWSEVVDLPMLEIRYETLAADPKPTLRDVLDFLDLPWDNALLRFHESKRVAATPSMDQVRQPINTSAVNRAAAF